MLIILIPGIIVLLGISIIISANVVINNIDTKQNLLNVEMNRYAYLDRNLTDPEVKAFKELRIKYDKLSNLESFFEGSKTVASWISSIIGVVLFIFLIALIVEINPQNVKQESIEHTMKYESLLLELDRQVSQDDINVRTKDIIDDVTEWNIEYEQFCYASSSIWTGIYNPMKMYEGTGYINLSDWLE